MSGAGSIKADGSDDDYLYEIKDANVSYTMNAYDLATLHHQAVIQGKTPRMIIKFVINDMVACITLTRSLSKKET